MSIFVFSLHAMIGFMIITAMYKSEHEFHPLIFVRLNSGDDDDEWW